MGRATDEVLAIIAHELRTPLAPMRTALDLVKGRTDDAARLARAHAILDEQLTRLVRLIDDLVDVSRLSRGALAIQPEELDLAHVVAGVLAARDRRADLPDAPVVVWGDPVRLAQIVATLVDDAMHRVGDGGGVRVVVGSDGDSAILSVEDDGPGLPRDGTCIGLTLVQELAELHGGDVTAGTGADGRGTAVVVRLPLHVEGAPEVRRRRALVVDDHEDGATLLAELLKDEGVEVSTAFDGASALAAVRRFEPDVVFLDIGLPDIGGDVVAQRIRASELATQPLLVALTGWSRTRAVGFDRHIVKPIDVASVRRVLAF